MLFKKRTAITHLILVFIDQYYISVSSGFKIHTKVASFSTEWSPRRSARPSFSTSTASSSRFHQECLVRVRLCVFLNQKNLKLLKAFALIAAFSLCLPRATPPVPTEPLLCKFADGGQKKRQNQGKYLQNGRPWARDPDTVSERVIFANLRRELPASHSCGVQNLKTSFKYCPVFLSFVFFLVG